MALERDRLQWDGFDFDFPNLLLSWAASTNVANIIYMRFLAVGLCWPPLRYISGFFNIDDED